MMKKITKTFLLLLLLAILFLPSKHARAMRAGTATIPSLDGGPSDSTQKPNISSSEGGIPLKKVECEYTGGGGSERNIDINAYDIEGNSVIPHTNVTGSKFKAGTFIGINLREFRSVSWYTGFGNTYEVGHRIVYSVHVNENYYDWFSRNCIPLPTDPIFQWACSHPCGEMDIYSTQREKFYSWGQLDDYAKELAQYPKKSGYCTIEASGNSPYRRLGSPSQELEDECRAKAVKNVISSVASGVSPTIQFEIKDPNDYNKSDITIASQTKAGTIKGKVKEFKQDTPVSVVVCGNPRIEIPFIVSPDAGHKKTYMPEGGIGAIAGIVDKTNYKCFTGGAYYATYEYSPGKTCINVKTSKVTYKKETDSCDSKTEKELEMGKTKDPYLNPGSDEEVEYWQYFVPFNTPTSDSKTDDKNDFFIRVESISPGSDEMGSPPECMEFLRRYPVKVNSNLLKYSDLIIAISSDGKQKYNLKGDYYGDSSEATSSDMQLFKNGYNCQVSTKLKFNIAQHFYGENKKEDKITGYSFYYRPINIDKPFPNKIAGNSIWLGLYDETTNEIKVKEKNSKTVITTKLSESFKEVTYSTEGISRNEILKKVDINENYTSWKNISAQYGTSSFITELNLRKNANTKKLYKLGCGPDNVDWSGCK